MKPLSRACVAGLAATALLTAMPYGSALADVVPLAAPSNLAPADDPAVFPHEVRKTVPLTWDAVPGATGYRVQVGVDDTWSAAPVLSADTVATELVLPVWLPHATYVWRVAALSGTDVGAWSSDTVAPEFTRGWRDAPQGLTPAPQDSTGPAPTFSWSPIAGASSYELEVSDSRAFPGVPTSDADTTPDPANQTSAGKTVLCTTTRDRFTPFTQVSAHGSSGAGDCTALNTALASGGTFYWRVRGLDKFVDAAQDVATTPANARTDSSEASNWSVVSDFTATAPTPSSPPVVFDGSAPVHTSSLANEADGLCSVTNPGATTAEHALCRDFASLAWSPITGADHYRLTVAYDDQLQNVQRVVDTTATSWTPTDAWADGSPSQSYYYGVTACSNATCDQATPVVSTPPSFRKASPRVVLGAVPAPRGPFSFDWSSYADALGAATSGTPTQDAVSYHLQVTTAGDPGFAAPVEDVTVDGTHYVSPKVSYADGTFLWRVQAVDSAAHGLPYSAVQSFLRDNTAPRLVSVAPSSRVGVLAPLTVTFSEPVTIPDVATAFALTPSAPFTATVVDARTVTLTPSAPMLPGASYRVSVSSAVTDVVGNPALAAGPSFKVNPQVDDGNLPVLTYVGTWNRLSSSSAIGGGFRVSTPTATAPTSVSTKVSGVAVSVTGCLSPTGGYADVFVDGAKKARVSTYRSYSGCNVLLKQVTGLVRGVHTVKLVGVGSHTSASRGNAVAFDAVTVTP